MAEAGKETIHYFVDEAGDPTLFNRKGRIIVNEDGCSNYFILGKMEIDEPAEVEQALEALRADLLKKAAQSGGVRGIGRPGI